MLVPARTNVALDFGLLLIRVIVAVVMVYHGSQKLFSAFGGMGMEGFAGYLESLKIPYPVASAYAAACAEFFGGILIGLGALTRLAAIPIAITMFVAAFGAHADDLSKMEFPLTLGVVATALIFTGAGRASIDGIIAARRRRRLIQTTVA